MFDAVISNGTLAAAASQLNMSQSAASRQIQELEYAVNLTLFHRTNRILVPTEAGLKFHFETQNILSGINEIPTIVNNIKTTSRDSLSVVSMPRLSLGVLAPAISQFIEANPQTNVTANVLRRYDIQRWAASRYFDVGLGMLPISHRSIISTPIFDVRAAVLMPKCHPLAKRDEILIEDLSDDKMIGYTSGVSFRDQMDDLIRSSGAEISYSMEVSSSLLACQLVAEGAGVTIIDAPSVSRFGFFGDLALVPLRPVRWWKCGLFHLHNSKQNPLTRSFEFCVRDIVQNLKKIPEFTHLIRLENITND